MDILADYQPMLIDYGIRLGLALLIFVLGRTVAGILRGVLRRLMEKRDVDPTLIGFICNVAYVAMVAFVIVAALGQIGIETASFVAIIGAAGLAIALAFQNSLSNLASGVLLVTFRPFKIGDFIEAGGTSGVVEKIEIFTTQIRTGDNKTIIVPNSGVTSGNIVNYSTKPTRRLDLVFGVGYNDNLDQVVEEVHRHKPTPGLLRGFVAALSVVTEPIPHSVTDPLFDHRWGEIRAAALLRLTPIDEEWAARRESP